MTNTMTTTTKMSNISDEFGFSMNCECASPKFYNDGFCDDANNVAECNFDGGDCCHYENWDQYCTECECKGAAMKKPSNTTTAAHPGNRGLMSSNDKCKLTDRPPNW